MDQIKLRVRKKTCKSILKEKSVSTVEKKTISFSTVTVDKKVSHCINYGDDQINSLPCELEINSYLDNSNSSKENNRKRKRMLLDKTICLDSSDDIINESIVVPQCDNKYITVKQNNFIKSVHHTNKTPNTKRYNLRNSGSPDSKPESKRTHVTPGKTNVTSGKTNVTPVKTNVTPVKTNVTPVKTNLTPVKTNLTPVRTTVDNDDIPVIYEPILSKSKRHDIEKWLLDNENINFINRPVSPYTEDLDSSLNLICKSAPPKSNYERKRNSNSCSSVDSDVHQVLTEIYGNDWKKGKRRLSGFKFKTEPKKPNVKIARSCVKKSKRNLSFTNVNNERDVAGGDNSCGSVSLTSMKSESEESFVVNRNFDGGIAVKRHRSKSSHSDESWQPTKRRKNPGSVTKVKTPKGDTIVPFKNKTPSMTPKKTFLASLSTSTPNSRCHPEAHFYKLNYKSKKEELVQKLFKLYNKEVFDGLLADDMDISWNIKLRGTAGFCYNKKRTSSKGEVTRSSRIELSTKVLDRADRLRDTLLHELCHAAAWVVDNTLDGHGAGWQKWANRAMNRFPELPVVKRCHNYEIATKFTYKCVGCGYSINRHSKSIDIDAKRCGYCYGRLELLVNKKKRGKGEKPEFDTTRTIKAPTGFALFVKQNYHCVKESNIDKKHGEIMKILSQKYSLVKNSTPKDVRKKS